MSEQEKLKLAEEFVRKAVKHLSRPVTEKDIMQAAKESAKSLPPFERKAVAQFRSELTGDDSISEEFLAYLEQRALGQFYDYVLGKFEDAQKRSGLTKAKLARRVRRAPDQVSRLLASPGNWTIGTVARLLAGIGSEEPILSSSALIGRSLKSMTRQRRSRRQISN